MYFVQIGFTVFVIYVQLINGQNTCSGTLNLPDGGCCTTSYCCLGDCCCDQECFVYGDCCDDVSEIGCEPSLSQMQQYPALCTDTCTKNGFTKCCENNNCETLCCSCDYKCHSENNCCNDIDEICQITTAPPPPTPNVCKKETDNVYNLKWPDTYATATATSRCPNNKIGQSTRLCNSTGSWEAANVSDCKTFYETIDKNLNAMGGNMSHEAAEEAVISVSQNINNVVTNVDENDITTINKILTNTLDILVNNLNSGNNNTPPVTDYLDIFNYLLEEEQLPTWESLNNEPNKTESEKFLESMEKYSNYVSRVILSGHNASNANDSFVRDKIELDVTVHNITSDGVYEFDIDDIYVSIPFNKLQGEVNGQVAFATYITRNVANVLPQLSKDPNRDVPATNTISVQIVSSTVTVVAATLNFTTKTFPNATNPQCAFYALNDERGSWSYDGVTIIEKSRNGTINDSNITYNIVCDVNHLTAFVVLIDVHGVLDQVPETELLALEILSYIGVGISCICMIITIIILATLKKELIKQVQYFIHLNLAIALLIGYILFLFGVDPRLIGRNSSVACAIVAGLLQYFFLAAFSWMMCEGIMLFLLLVIVFSKISKKWYIFLAIGWGLPVVPVVITAGVVPKAYGVPGEYCWIDYTYRNALWSFLGPMIAILTVNVLFLLLSIRALILYNRRREKNRGRQKIGYAVFRKSILGTLTLVPLLGITWLIGLFSISAQTSVFAWLFVLGSTLQGLFILVFNIVRNEKIKTAAFKFFCPRLEKQRRSEQTRDTKKRMSTASSIADIEMT